eukprot:scaffold2437_cov395-Prasinococcus_capsulatus_cf.AAC.27
MFKKLKRDESRKKDDAATGAGMSPPAEVCHGGVPGERISFFGVKYGKQAGKIGLLGDRVVGNTLEQALLFLPLLWMHAIFVSPETAANYGYWTRMRRVGPLPNVRRERLIELVARHPCCLSCGFLSGVSQGGILYSPRLHRASTPCDTLVQVLLKAIGRI